MIVYPLDENGREVRDGWAPEELCVSHGPELGYKEVSVVLSQIQHRVREECFHVQLGDLVPGKSTRRKNREFMQAHGIFTKDDQKNLLLRVETEDYCHAVYGSDQSVLYVFCLETVLQNEAGCDGRVRIYIKHNYPAPGTKDDVVISLHDLERPIELPFRD